MGKGFNNYMCKKFFHPASRDNQKRLWMAEQQAESYKKKQEELRLQYEKEQDLYTNKALMSKESKEKLSVNFMYEPPPGTKKEREREDNEPEYKFEWQRKYNAPRESYCKGDQEIRDQPFGIQVRNVKCIKCHKWGHINTDKECPMYNQFATSIDENSSVNTVELLKQMREDGLEMKKGAAGLLELPLAKSNSHQLVSSSSEDEDHMNESELKFLKQLSTKQKKKLLKKLEKLEKKKKKAKKEKKNKKEKKKERKSESESSSDDDDSDVSSEKRKKKRKSNEKDFENGIQQRTIKRERSPMDRKFSSPDTHGSGRHSNSFREEKRWSSREKPYERRHSRSPEHHKSNGDKYDKRRQYDRKRKSDSTERDRHYDENNKKYKPDKYEHRR